MSIDSNKISLSIIGKPNSGKSTLFNCLLGEYLSPVGDEYGLTKNIYREVFKYKNTEFTIIDTPGLRRRNKVIEKNEITRNSEVIKVINKVEVIILLIDSLENITRQDFKLADISISKYKMLFFLFNKLDLIDDTKKFKLKVNRLLKNSYSKYNMINVEYISAKKNIKIKDTLNQIIKKKDLVSIKIHKRKLNKFIEKLQKTQSFPKIRGVALKPKYIVQIDSEILLFKVFINSKKKAPQIFQKYFDNAFRIFFKLEGIPIKYIFVSSKNPFSN